METIKDSDWASTEFTTLSKSYIKPLILRKVGESHLKERLLLNIIIYILPSFLEVIVHPLS